MKRFLLVLAGALLLTLFAAAAAYADGGPHGGYTSTGGAGNGLPDQCAACHRVHQGQSVGKLLKASSQYALCLTCHNGAGSRLDVLDGVKLDATVDPDSAVVRQADILYLTATVIPDAALSVGAGGNTSITIAVRNRYTGGARAVSLAVASDSNGANFDPSTLTSTPSSVPAMAGDIPGVAYARLTTKAKVAAAAGAINITTINVTDTASATTAVIKVETRVAAAGDIETGGQYGVNTLNGGGFRYINGVTVTSRHNADPADNTLQPWGYQTNSGLKSGNLSSPLQCTSCHNPHGTSNYRLLKTSINSQSPVVKVYFNSASGTSTMALMKDEGGPGISSTGGWQPTDKYTKEYYASEGTGGSPTTGAGSIASLCGACHNAYPSDGASTGYTAGGVTHYRHATEKSYLAWSNPDPAEVANRANPETQTGGSNTAKLAGFPTLRLASKDGMVNEVVTCLTCHRVHGSASTMTGYSLTKQYGGLGDNDLTPSQLNDETMLNGRSESTLLYTNNRGMCQACHQW
ncbi:MAG: cytochrome c3 family protein [Chloroflexi bacterium]|nr:cytochrome c3 family protein [Chloroflexota bacterium]